MTWTTIFGLMTMAGLFVCMIPLIYSILKSQNLNEQLVGVVLDDNLEIEKRIYERIWNELDGLLIQTKQVERLKENYQKKIVELEEMQALNSTKHEKVHYKKCTQKL